MIFAEDAFVAPPWFKRPLWSGLGRVFVFLAVLAGLIGFPVLSVVSRHRQKVKVIADAINPVVPSGETLYAVDPNYQPFFFYINAPVIYVGSLEDLPNETHYFLVRPDNAKEAASLERWAPRHPHELTRKKDYRNQTVILFRVDSA